MTAYPPPPPGGYPPPPGGGYPPQQPPGGGFPPPGGPYGYSAPPDNYLVWAVLSTLFCCLPLGVFSIIKSTQVSGLWAQGQYAAAQQAANDAKKYAIWGAIIGPIISIAFMIIYFVFVAVMVSTSTTY